MGLSYKDVEMVWQSLRILLLYFRNLDSGRGIGEQNVPVKIQEMRESLFIFFIKSSRILSVVFCDIATQRNGMRKIKAIYHPTPHFISYERQGRSIISLPSEKDAITSIQTPHQR